MPTEVTKPNIIICGGINFGARALAAFLVPLHGERLVGYLRIIDRVSVKPPTVYVGSEFPKILEQPNVEYRQANLSNAAVTQTCFDPPPGHGAFDYVFDLTGELGHDRSEGVHIANTFHVARCLGLEASKRKVKAYVRFVPAIYQTLERGSHDEKEAITPFGNIGKWTHEALRALGNMAALNLVILRTGLLYGTYLNIGYVFKSIILTAVFAYQGGPIPWIYPSDPRNTLHVRDLAGGLWACAQWIASIGRSKANEIAGEMIPFLNDKRNVGKVEGMVLPDAIVGAPLFNLADDSNAMMADIAHSMSAVFNSKPEFIVPNSLASKLAAAFLANIAKILGSDVRALEEANEQNVSVWNEMLMASDPPIPESPLSCFVEQWEISSRSIAYNSDKFKQIVGYRLQVPKFNENGEVEEIISLWKSEGSWPDLTVDARQPFSP